ncbi:MAG TPA: polysaccharide biosynthesis/export family protein [Candidatus Cybelea sp.]|nr:polysaccharide biosynthesis/export family protein [Candidatus Cybelea sp.]
MRITVVLAQFILLASPLPAQNARQPVRREDRATLDTAQDFNRRLEDLGASLARESSNAADYRIGADDVLEVSVFGAPELNHKVRVSAAGDISIPLIGSVEAAGLTARELERVLETKLRAYMNEPHVGVFVSSIESHPVSVIGEVTKPGVFQVRGPKTLLEMLSMAQGLTDNAGDKVIVMRGAGFGSEPHDGKDATGPDPPDQTSRAGETETASAADLAHQTVEVDLRLLLDTGNPAYNVPIYPGDIIKVTRAGIVYVVGGVKRPGGFTIQTNERMSLLKAVSLAEGLTPTAAKRKTRIIRTDELSGHRSEIPVDLGKVLAGKIPDVPLRAADIVFVPNSNSKSAFFKGTETAVATASGVVIFRPY